MTRINTKFFSPQRTGMWFVNGRHSKVFFSNVSCLCGPEDKALQECNLSVVLPVECGCIHPDIDLGAGIFHFRDAAQATA